MPGLDDGRWNMSLASDATLKWRVSCARSHDLVYNLHLHSPPCACPQSLAKLRISTWIQPCDIHLPIAGLVFPLFQSRKKLANSSRVEMRAKIEPKQRPMHMWQEPQGLRYCGPSRAFDGRRGIAHGGFEANHVEGTLIPGDNF